MIGPKAARKRGTTWRGVCKLALRWPGVTEGTSYGTPALHVGKRFLARLKEDGETMAIKIDFSDREFLLEFDPSTFYLTDHYRAYPAVLVRLKQVPAGLLEEVIERACGFRRRRASPLKPRHGRPRADDRHRPGAPGCHPPSGGRSIANRPRMLSARPS